MGIKFFPPTSLAPLKELLLTHAIYPLSNHNITTSEGKQTVTCFTTDDMDGEVEWKVEYTGNYLGYGSFESPDFQSWLQIVTEIGYMIHT